MTTSAHDMSAHWRLISAQGESETHSISGTWWVSATNVKPVDVSIWVKRAQYGRVFYSDDMTAFIRDGEVDLPRHMIRSSASAEAEDAWDLLLEVIAAAAAAFRPEESDHA